MQTTSNMGVIPPRSISDNPTKTEPKKRDLLDLTFSEAIYVAFIHEKIESAVKDCFPIFYLTTSVDKQVEFDYWVIRYLPRTPFTEKELKLSVIIDSLWQKTEQFIKDHYQYKNFGEIATQTELYAFCKKMDQCSTINQLVGRAFTLLQMQHLDCYYTENKPL